MKKDEANVINPIETNYKGYRMRSRAEARWAVFFDKLGIKWQYETEGFEHNGVRYLPDFYLPEDDVYVEVKGNWEKLREDMPKMLENIYWGGPIKKLLLLGEVPTPKKIGYKFWMIGYDSLIDATGVVLAAFHLFERDDTYKWFVSHSWNTFTPFVREEDDLYYYLDVFDWDMAHRPYVENRITDLPLPESMEVSRADEAFTVSRSARFEHGETPA